MGFLKKMFDSNAKELRELEKIVAAVNARAEDAAKASDEELAARTIEFKNRLENGESLDDLLPEAFATVREASKRTLGLYHYDVQIIGGAVLHQGKIAEMKTGEGKTLVATLAAYSNAISGKGVHVITVNDYLAKRDAEWMGPIYRFLGMDVGVIVHGITNEERAAAYRADITYGTNNEFGFDYLRDNMVSSFSQRVQRGHNFAIVDEVDSILIDEARTPLIISGQAEESTYKYTVFAQIASRLVAEEDYNVDEKAKTVAITEDGVAKVEKMLNVENLYDEKYMELVQHLNASLRAKALMFKDRDYIIKDGEVVIVDEFTGRLMFGRRYSDGLHQAIEAKEGVKVQNESTTMATITFQNYFRMYDKLSGMTGTAATEEEEFIKIYNLPVVQIPTAKPVIRVDNPDVVYKTQDAKYKAIVEEICDCYARKQPVLVGTVSVEKSEKLSSMITKRGIPHKVLNAKYHEKEAEIIKMAGQAGAVTIATNMAGRGTDIVLGEGAAECGGLHVIGTERHESRRIDNQLRGRSGRQGDPGSSRFYVALDDDLMRLFGGETITKIMNNLGWKDDEAIEHPQITKSIESAQKRVEAQHFDTRKHVLEYDDVMNKQRVTMYGLRDEVLSGENLKEKAMELIDTLTTATLKAYADEKMTAEHWDLDGLAEHIASIIFVKPEEVKEKIEGKNFEELTETIRQMFVEGYENKEKLIGPARMRDLERAVMLHMIDTKWIEHLQAMEYLKEGINLRAYGQKDPLIEYRKEAFEMFNELQRSVAEDFIKFMFAVRIEMKPQPQPGQQQVASDVQNDVDGQQTAQSVPKAEEPAPAPRIMGAPLRSKYKMITNRDEAGPVKPVKRDKEKVGRNDPCPCGSGKKYKKCCGAEDKGSE